MTKSNATRVVICGLVGLCGQLLNGQNTFPSYGAVGIGTSSPQQPLRVMGNIVVNGVTQHIDSGNKMEVVGVAGQAGGNSYIVSSTADGYIQAYTGPASWGAPYGGAEGFNGTLTSSTFSIRTANLDRIVVLAGGNVGIGTGSPVHLLHVAGTIGAEEIIVSSTGADYVFDPSYRLRPLEEVHQFIEQHHHLPDMPSASEVKEKGLSLGEMQAKLLAKVEELTLHMIAADEHNRRLEAEVAELKKRPLQAMIHTGN